MSTRTPMSIFPPKSATMPLRLKRQAMALLSYLMFLLPMLYAVDQGWMMLSLTGVLVFVLLSVLVNVVFYVLIRSGYSERFKDPSLTFPQIFVSLLMGLILVRYAGQARPVFITLFFASFFFGIFGLSRRQFWILAGTTIVGYAAMIATQVLWMGPSAMTIRLAFLELIALSMISCWMAAIGGYVVRLRQKLVNQKSALVQVNKKLNFLVSHDELTGVFNRRQLMKLLEDESNRNARHGTEFCVALLDIDHFKSINDTYGHATGDDVLREFSSRMLHNIRSLDAVGRPSLANGAPDETGEYTVGRYGGEEFMVVMPHTTLSNACICIERLRSVVSGSPFSTGQGSLQVLFSAGVSQFKIGEEVNETIARADKALYRAKASGRNQTKIELPEQG